MEYDGIIELGSEVGPKGLDGSPIYDLRQHKRLKIPKYRQPSLNQEFQRSIYVSQFRSQFIKMTREEFHVDPVKDAFDRFLFAQIAVPKTMRTTSDPLFCRPELAYETDILSVQLFNVIPSSNYIPWKLRNNRKEIFNIINKWKQNAYQWFSQHENKYSEEAKTACKEIKFFGNNNTIQKQFIDLQDRCRPYFVEATKQGMERIGEFMCVEAHKYVNTLQSVQDNSVNVIVEDHTTYYTLTYNGDIQKVSKIHAEKLRRLFEMTALLPFTKIDESIWILLRRYTTFFGDTSASMHAASPETTFRYLKQLGVSHECFASPFNCYFSNYNSAFLDTDAPFGSRGSFFDFSPKTGSFEVGPPYTLEVMEKTAQRCEMLLSQTDEPLSFILFNPDWRKPLQPAQIITESSQFLQENIMVKGKTHQYVIGDQHNKNTSRHFILPFDTRIYVLQNKAGAEKWPLPNSFSTDIIKSLIIS
jgi:phosphorylated CTD-interacting factor 1